MMPYDCFKEPFPSPGDLLGTQKAENEVKSFSRVRLFATPWTVAYQASPSMGFFRQEYWSGLPFPSPRDLPNPGIELESPVSPADSLPLSHLGSPYNG